MRHSPRPVVLIATLPESVYLDVERQGLVRVESFVGATDDDPLQTVFSPESFPIVNRHATWEIFDPNDG
ncbi:MAG: hypothetical protein M3Y74_12895 [Chloroflexota bacterium]|nr:hypothetical protein [Chloroflexota bacterium]